MSTSGTPIRIGPLSGEPVAAIALRNNKSGEAIVIVSDWANGGVAKIAPDAATLELGEGFKAYDFEAENEIPVSNGAVEVRLARHDFKIVKFVTTKRQ